MTTDFREVDHDALEKILREVVDDGAFILEVAKRHGIKPGRLRAWMAADQALAERVNEAARDAFEAIALRSRRTIRGDSVNGDSTGDTVRDKAIIEHDMKLLALYDKRWNPKQEVEHKVSVTHEEFLARLAAESPQA